MNIPWSGFTKKRKYKTEQDRLQYKDLAAFHAHWCRDTAKYRAELLN